MYPRLEELPCNQVMILGRNDDAHRIDLADEIPMGGKCLARAALGNLLGSIQIEVRHRHQVSLSQGGILLRMELAEIPGTHHRHPRSVGAHH